MTPPPVRYKTFRSSDGFYIVVGNSAADNDQLSLFYGQPDDLWFHVNGCPGSHVIIRRRGEGDVPRSTIEEAASLAAYYSKARNAAKAPVHMTQCKYVSKPPGAPAGQVNIAHFRAMKAEPRLCGERLEQPPDDLWD